VVAVGRERFRLDLAYEEEMLAVELDGRAYHAGVDQWERDIRRDGLLATIGWQTLRFSHRRLTLEIPGCRRQTLDVLAARRRWRLGR
jgi:very-short-patch-repair endonuclease